MGRHQNKEKILNLCDRCRYAEFGKTNDVSLEINFIDIKIGKSVLQDGVESGKLRISKLADADVSLRSADVVRWIGFGQKFDEFIWHLVNLFPFVIRIFEANGTELPQLEMPLALRTRNHLDYLFHWDYDNVFALLLGIFHNKKVKT